MPPPRGVFRWKIGIIMEFTTVNMVNWSEERLHFRKGRAGIGKKIRLDTSRFYAATKTWMGRKREFKHVDVGHIGAKYVGDLGPTTSARAVRWSRNMRLVTAETSTDSGRRNVKAGSNWMKATYIWGQKYGYFATGFRSPKTDRTWARGQGRWGSDHPLNETSQ